MKYADTFCKLSVNTTDNNVWLLTSARDGVLPGVCPVVCLNGINRMLTNFDDGFLEGCGMYDYSKY